jgi:hypothetical protein
MTALALQWTRFGAVLLFTLPVLGCSGQGSAATAREPDPPPNNEMEATQPASAVRDAAPVPPPSVPEPRDPAVPAQGSSGSRANGKQLSPKEALEILLDSRFSAIVPAEAKQKLSRVSEVRETALNTTAGVNIYAETCTPRFFVGYVQDSGGAWAFVNAKATAVAGDEKNADVLYKDYERALRKRYGRPAWVNDNAAPPPIKGWSADGGTLEVSLTARTNEVGEAIIELNLFEPQGEPE